jgi:hypothetical protein
MRNTAQSRRIAGSGICPRLAWTKPGESDLYSFAAITDEPTPEVSATGHKRTVITIEEPYLSEWLNPLGLDKQRLEHILSDKKVPYYIHQIAE